VEFIQDHKFRTNAVGLINVSHVNTETDKRLYNREFSDRVTPYNNEPGNTSVSCVVVSQLFLTVRFKAHCLPNA